MASRSRSGCVRNHQSNRHSLNVGHFLNRHVLFCKHNPDFNGNCFHWDLRHRRTRVHGQRSCLAHSYGRSCVLLLWTLHSFFAHYLAFSQARAIGPLKAFGRRKISVFELVFRSLRNIDEFGGFFRLSSCAFNRLYCLIFRLFLLD